MQKLSKIKCLAVDVDGVLTDGHIFLGLNGEWRRNFYIRDGLGLVMLKNSGYKTGIITTSLAEDIQARAKNLKIDYFYENSHNKADALSDLLQKSGFKPHEIAFIGDDVIDLPVFQLVGVSFAPADAHPDVKKKADFLTKASGGRGAVREVCDLILKKGAYSK